MTGLCFPDPPGKEKPVGGNPIAGAEDGTLTPVSARMMQIPAQISTYRPRKTRRNPCQLSPERIHEERDHSASVQKRLTTPPSSHRCFSWAGCTYADVT